MLGLVLGERQRSPAAAEAPLAPLAFARLCLRLCRLQDTPDSPAQGFPLVEKTWSLRSSDLWESDPHHTTAPARAGLWDAPEQLSWPPVPCQPLPGLKHRSAPSSQHVRAARPTVLPSADQLPDWWMRWRPWQRGEGRIQSCQVQAASRLAKHSGPGGSLIFRIPRVVLNPRPCCCPQTGMEKSGFSPTAWLVFGEEGKSSSCCSLCAELNKPGPLVPARRRWVVELLQLAAEFACSASGPRRGAGAGAELLWPSCRRGFGPGGCFGSCTAAAPAGAVSAAVPRDAVRALLLSVTTGPC